MCIFWLEYHKLHRKGGDRLTTIDQKSKIQISFRQLFLLTVAQAGGASILYLPGVVEAGRDVWISNIIASSIGYIVIFAHYLPLSQCPGWSMTQTINRYWGHFIGGIVNLYYALFFFILCCLIVSDIYYFGKITLPETPGYVFIIFFSIPAVYGVKLGLETIARLIEFLLPILIGIYCLLFLLLLPKLEFTNLLPIMSGGIKPIIGGAIPNMNFPYAQILPMVFFYQHTKNKEKGQDPFLKYTFLAILMSTVLLTFKNMASVAAFEEATLITLTFPPFSAVRLIQIADVIERLDSLFLAIFYCTTFFKFMITYYVICQMISDYFKIAEPKALSVPLVVLIGVSMPFLIPRFDVILKTIVAYFFASIPLFLPIPILLYLTIRIKQKKKKNPIQRGS